MAAPLIDPYVAELERENENLIEALSEALSRKAVAEGERDQLANRVRDLECALAWDENTRIDLRTQLERERHEHARTATHLRDLIAEHANIEQEH